MTTAVIYKRYYKTRPPELEEISQWTVFTRFNISEHIHLFYIQLQGEIVAYAFVTEHEQVPILEGAVKLPGFHYLLDYLEVRRENRHTGLSSALLTEISSKLAEPIVLETMPDTTGFFVRRGAQYIREPVEGGVNVMALNLDSRDNLDRRTKKRFHKWNNLIKSI